MNEFGLDDRATSLILSVLENHPKIVEARIFGSRAKGTFRPESDVDLALLGDLDANDASRIAGELDDLSFPFRFDVQAYSRIKYAPLRAHIDRVGKPLFVRRTPAQ